MSASQIARIGTFIKLMEDARGDLGRTALMKLCFFLQVLKKVPLSYSFSLYSYGPFDSDVLADLQAAEGLGVLSSQVEYYAGGYRYSISKGPQASQVIPMAADFVDAYRNEISWVAQTFSQYTASDLELMSTLVFVATTDTSSSDDFVAQEVKRIKPHFSLEKITSTLNWLSGQNLLRSGQLI